MIRTLMLGTAVAAVLTLSALAQDSSSSSSAAASSSSQPASASSSQPAPASSSSQASQASSSQPQASSSASASSAGASSAAASSETTTQSSGTSTLTTVTIATGYTQAESDRLATRIIGSPVYDGPAANANNLGKINDLVIDENGRVAAVVLGVGGFLGIAEKQVAVGFSALHWVVAADNTKRFVLQTTKDELTKAPDFKTVETPPAGGNNAASSSALEQAMSSSSSAM